MNKVNFVCIVVLSLASAGWSQSKVVLKDLAQAPQTRVVHVGDLENRKIDEASGMACSRLNDHVLWLLNDSGGGHSIFAIDNTGKDLGAFKVDGAKNRDWEDMACFEYEGKSWLMLADTGDNKEQRKKCRLYFVMEPDLSNNRHRFFLPLYSKMQFTYEDGPRDCESVAVDVKQGKILLLSKRNNPPVLYELPLDIGPRISNHTAVRVKAVETIPLPTMEEIRKDPRFGPFGSQPTAMDISSDGKNVLVLTYQNAYIFEFKGDWKQTFTQLPLHVNTPSMAQAESACFALDSKTIYITSEKLPTPLFRIF